ncbi:carboxypeptidase regulatory-like domain-containing protein [Microtetraspora sp. AC03309]|uniref:carboxypeptidase regulatory-like domain-containing protein n=1 Tax=Microtetraspora sp. AC03309 TaxID=2779376 RepID=UPI001E3A821E|nr:carboxypeptidase regulatory-like domain-containing protein [Microtetraspora sp. AC03309]MCC5581357.1 carboxypeptidase regulatory-like domain-containing protein [Microtetraspora sp. AC03309]
MRRLLPALLVPALLLGFAAPAAAGPPPPPVPERLDRVIADTLAKQDTTDVFVMLKEKADLSGARTLRGHTEKADYGFRTLRETAERSQKGLRAFLRESRATFTPYWLVNSVLVRGAGPDLVRKLAERPDVARVRPAGSVSIPEPDRSAQAVARAAAGVEWGVDSVGAPRVWSQFGARGEGVVVATIDSGVQYDHPALAARYRGRKADGTYDHNYNWFDPTRVCGSPSVTPCDNNGHGTHTMGTIVGADGIGVAPGATWITAKGCESNTCSDDFLLTAGQWMLAPTDLQGNNPRPDLAPHLVSNSWGGDGGDPFYQEIVDAWVASGIFPLFAAGNEGPACGTAHSPGDYENTYAVGAYQSDGKIADFSSRGDPEAAGIKPNITAPGAAVRSSVPGGEYEVLSGTSMATPHVAGALALLWSAAPALRGDVAATRLTLDETAVDATDYSCGGTSADNRVWGQGRLDAFAAVTFAPRGTTGTLTGTVRDAVGSPVPNPTVTLTTSGAKRTTQGGADGSFSLRLPPGSYEITAWAFGYAPATGTATVSAGGTATRDLTLSAVPRYDVYGEVRQTGGEPLPGAVVSIDGTPYTPVTTESDGTFAMFGVPVGTWRINVQGARCGGSTTVTLEVDGDEFLPIDTPLRTDDFGNKCDVIPQLSWEPGTTALALTGDDAGVAVTLPFAFPLYGKPYTKAWISTNGFINFQRLSTLSFNGRIPSGGLPNAAIYAFWDDLNVDSSAQVLTTTLGTAPNRRYVVEWRNVSLVAQPTARLTFSAELHENGQILFQYKSLSNGLMPRGSSATIGIENGTGLIAFEYATDVPVLRTGMGIRFYGSGVIQGVVRDSAGTPLKDVEIALSRPAGGTLLDTVTDASGVYRLYAPADRYAVIVSEPEWAYWRKDVPITQEGQVIDLDITLYPPKNTITGTVRDSSGKPLPGATVAVMNLDVKAATTDATGSYTLTDVRGGTQWIQVFTRACDVLVQKRLTVSGDIVVDLTQGMPVDDSGFACARKPTAWVAGTDAIDVNATTSSMVALPFAFPLSGDTFTSVGVTGPGLLLFYDPMSGAWSWAAPYSHELTYDSQSSVRTATMGESFVIEWRDVLVGGTDTRITFEGVLYPDGRMLFQYRDLPDDREVGNKQTAVGVSNAYGPDMFLVRGTLDPQTAFEIRPAPQAE